MFCKHCGKKIPEGQKVCPGCGKPAGNDIVKIILAAVAGVLVVALLVGVVYVSTYGWPNSDGEPTIPPMPTLPTDAPGTTPTDGNPEDVSCKGTYTGDVSLVESEKNTVVATMGEYQLTNGQLQVYYWMGVLDFVNYWGNYVSYFGLDMSKPLDQQLYDKETGQSWQQYFLEEALNNWHQDHAMFLEAEKAGFVMEKQYQDYLDNLYEELKKVAEKEKLESVDAMLQQDMGPGADFQGYHYYITRYYKGNLYYNANYEKTPVTMEEIEAYFEKNKESIESSYKVNKESGIIADVQYLLFFPEGATAETVGTQTFDEKAWEDARAKAQAVLDKWVAEGATEEGFAELIKQYGVETNTAGAADDYKGLPRYDMSEVDIRHILLQPEGGTKDENNKTVYTEEAWEACRQKAQALLDQWVADGADEAVFINLAKEHSVDGNAKDGGIYKNVTKGYMVAEFDEWIFDYSREYGDYGLVKTEFGYHLMFFVHGDTEVDEWTFDEARQVGDYTLVKTDYGYYVLRFTGSEEGWIRYSRQGLQAEKMTEQITAQYPMTVEYEKILLWTADLT
ncbi:MAG: peptidylprolyl isomerase [Oscillospiraceae bacterium]|nr:peptidylprolyl isomerase [Oscillospiraceae bacterium]